MTFIYDDPAAFAEDALIGLCDAYGHLLRHVPGGAVRRHAPEPKVAVLYCGGSGHYPAFAGVVGPGLGDGAVCGNIFTSPSTDNAVSVAKAADRGRGLIFSYGNYAGDVMNFGLATDRLRAEGYRVENVIVTDDVASAPVTEIERRRGIAGDFTVFKAMGAAAERGDDFDEVVRIGRKANDATRTMGVAFAGCTMPGADQPLFTIEPGVMGLGLGIHGEPGLDDVPLPRASELATVLVDRVLAERPAGATRAAVILNGLGATKYEELFVLWKSVGQLLREAGITLVGAEVGELVTSLDMAGTSLTVMYLDDELEELWLAPALTPAFQRGTVAMPEIVSDQPAATEPATPDPPGPLNSLRIRADPANADESERAPGTPASREAATRVLRALHATATRMRDAESELGQIDAIAGDGDHGRGMVRGSAAAVAAAQPVAAAGVGVQDLLNAAGASWADKAGGTSGVLWGAGLQAVGDTLGNDRAVGANEVVLAARAFVARLQALGKAGPGDKTMLDAAVPFVDALAAAVAAGTPLPDAAAQAARVATEAAQATAALSPRVGRARPLAAKSVGTPDPGAVSFAMIVTEAHGALS
ncbi:MAG: dihydroxyacetone kinase family protein [Propioniciclava sp.]